MSDKLGGEVLIALVIPSPKIVITGSILCLRFIENDRAEV